MKGAKGKAFLASKGTKQGTASRCCMVGREEDPPTHGSNVHCFFFLTADFMPSHCRAGAGLRTLELCQDPLLGKLLY